MGDRRMGGWDHGIIESWDHSIIESQNHRLMGWWEWLEIRIRIRIKDQTRYRPPPLRQYAFCITPLRLPTLLFCVCDRIHDGLTTPLQWVSDYRSEVIITIWYYIRQIWRSWMALSDSHLLPTYCTVQSTYCTVHTLYSVLHTNSHEWNITGQQVGMILSSYCYHIIS